MSTVMEFAQKRLEECTKEGQGEDCHYWAACPDGAKAQREEDGRGAS